MGSILWLKPVVKEVYCIFDVRFELPYKQRKRSGEGFSSRSALRLGLIPKASSARFPMICCIFWTSDVKTLSTILYKFQVVWVRFNLSEEWVEPVVFYLRDLLNSSWISIDYHC